MGTINPGITAILLCNGVQFHCNSRYTEREHGLWDAYEISK